MKDDKLHIQLRNIVERIKDNEIRLKRSFQELNNTNEVIGKLEDELKRLREDITSYLIKIT